MSNAARTRPLSTSRRGRRATAESKRTARPRLQDVASAAGVSIMTVVRVLRDPDKVATRTRERVAQVLAQTGYTPDLVARGLASNRSMLIGAIIPVLTNSLIAEIMQGLADAVAPQGYHLLLGASGFSAHEEEALVRAFLSRRVDALYLTGVTHSGATVEMLRRSGIPVVEGGNLSDAPIDMVVGYSNVDAGRMVTRHLLTKYAGPVGYIGAFPTDNDRARDRRRGYELALKAARRKLDPSLCIETALDVDSGARAMAELLDRHSHLRAVFCSADALAVGALYECQRRRLTLPERLAIAGFDDIPLAAQVVPALTTLRVPRYAIGQRAGELIMARLAGATVRDRVVDTGFELMLRQSA